MRAESKQRAMHVVVVVDLLVQFAQELSVAESQRDRSREKSRNDFVVVVTTLKRSLRAGRAAAAASRKGYDEAFKAERRWTRWTRRLRKVGGK